jgi:hypothetical protein
MSIVRWWMSLGLGAVGWVEAFPATAQTNQALVGFTPAVYERRLYHL